jgi:hypothetical protein
MKASRWLKRFIPPAIPVFTRVSRNLALDIDEAVEVTISDLDTRAKLSLFMTPAEALKLGYELIDAADERAAAAHRKHYEAPQANFKSGS